MKLFCSQNQFFEILDFSMYRFSLDPVLFLYNFSLIGVQEIVQSILRLESNSLLLYLEAAFCPL